MRGANTNTSSRARPGRLQLGDLYASVINSRLPRLRAYVAMETMKEYNLED